MPQPWRPSDGLPPAPAPAGAPLHVEVSIPLPEAALCQACGGTYAVTLAYPSLAAAQAAHRSIAQAMQLQQRLDTTTMGGPPSSIAVPPIPPG